MGGGTDAFVDESFSGNADTMVQEGGKLPSTSVSRLYLHHRSTIWPIGIGSKAGLIRKIGRQLILIGVPSNASVSTVEVPLVGAVTCGTPMLAEENVQTRIPVSTAFAKKGSPHFLLRAIGDSMNQAGIKSGDLLLVRQEAVAEDGDRVVALINDEATVKIFEQADGAVILRPKSSNKKHKPIVLTDNCVIQGVVVAVLPGDLH